MQGPLIDAQFEQDRLPAVLNALTVRDKAQKPDLKVDSPSYTISPPYAGGSGGMGLGG